jgi:outer membrane protein TolC
MEGNKRAALPPRAGILVAAALLLAGCAGFSKDGGFDSVQRAVRENAGKEIQVARTPSEQGAIASRVGELLKRPLGVEEAVQIALLNNRGLQASFQELGIAEADLVQAGRLPNPHISVSRSRVGGDMAVEQALSFNIFALVTMPIASEIEKRRFARTRNQVSLEVLRLASDTRKLYFTAVAAEEGVRYMRQVRTAAEASAELARRLAEVGNWSRLNRVREQGFYADTALQLARAEQAAASAREQLTRLMGLWGKDIAFQLPERLADLPGSADELPNLESLAMERRLDLRMMRLDAEAQAKNLGLAKATRFINVLELGVAQERETAADGDVSRKRTYEIAFELPIFDFGTSRLARAEAVYLQTLHRAAETAVNARSEVRQAYRGYRASYDIARHLREEIVPLRKRIAEENLLRYNGMLIGVFELLADARSQILSVNSSIEALRDFWIARADLDMALIGKPTISRPQGASGSQAEAAGGH